MSIKLSAVIMTMILGVLQTSGASEGKSEAVVTKQVLSKHATVAVFDGVEFKRCMGRTAACPDSCGHSGRFAQFTIKEYSAYERPGKYGDKKQTKYRVQLSGFAGKEGGDKAIIAEISKLKAGDEVVLNWTHHYVTKKVGETTSKYPEREVTKLEKR